MTTFVAWVGVDSRGPSSVNFATDSRISWGKTGIYHWDMGCKTFSSDTSPDIFGYINDVMFPSMILAQIINAIDHGVLFKKSMEFSERASIVESHVRRSHEIYPEKLRESFCIFHGGRDGSGLSSKFYLNTIAWSKQNSEWRIEKIPIPDKSSAIKIDGSGGEVVKRWAERWESSSQGGTSRAVFSSFCNAVHSGEDKLTNGAPQLVSLVRKGGGKTVGYVDGGRAFLSGIEVVGQSSASEESELKWVNRYFERCSVSGTRLENAQRHHVPKGLE